MAQGTESSHASSGQNWQQISIAFLLGFIVFGFMMSFVTVHQPAVGATINALPLFVTALVFGVISLPLLWWETSVGYVLTILTVLWGLVGFWLVSSGTVGSMKTGTPPIGGVGGVLVGVVLLVSTYLAWRK